MMYSADLPISTHQSDLLGRASYAKDLAHTIVKYGMIDSLCIGLLGSWGSGKTSILNMMLEEINVNTADAEKPLVIRFDPWNFTSTDQLLQQFFMMLANTLLSEDDKKKNAIGNALAEYGDAFDALGSIPFVGGALASLGKAGAKAASEALNSGTARKGILEQKRVVEKLLQEYDKKLLIVIDDIDRLSNDQIRQVFQLVTAVARFPNTIYLLVFDRDVVVKALEKVQEGNGNAYLEKVIQVPLSIPEISREKRESILFNRLDAILNAYTMRLDQSYWQRVFPTCIRPYLKSLREINRLSNLLQFKLASISQEVNFTDMVALSTIELTYPEIYEWIKRNKGLLTGRWDSLVLPPFNWDTKEQKIYSESREWLKNLLVQNGYPSEQGDVDRLCSCIKTLFPHWSEKSVPQHALNELRSMNRVAHPDKFNRYFNLDISEIVLLRSDVESAMMILPFDKLCSYMHELDDQNLLDELFSEIESLCNKLTPERAKTLVHTLLQHGIQFNSRSSRHMFGIAASDLAKGLVRSIISAQRNVDWGEYLVELMKDADWDMVIGISLFLHVMILAYGRHTNEGPRYEYERVISEEELKRLEDAYADKIKENIDSYDILAYPKGRIPFFIMKCIDKEFIDQFLIKALGSPINIVKYLAASVSRWTGSSVGYELHSQYLDHVNDQAAMEAITTCVANQTLFTLSAHEQNAAAAYYLLKIDNADAVEDNCVPETATQELLEKWKRD